MSVPQIVDWTIYTTASVASINAGLGMSSNCF